MAESTEVVSMRCRMVHVPSEDKPSNTEKYSGQDIDGYEELWLKDTAIESGHSFGRGTDCLGSNCTSKETADQC